MEMQRKDGDPSVNWTPGTDDRIPESGSLLPRENMSHILTAANRRGNAI